eukprot:TRINITY_DN10797_c0_g3_i1.p1 TRINITY_DN10797_c0_g3~~TRINITY_DN10797_c0_g3_i1.p1  ORF type:complete len:135 (+),score=24.82 TRINITY_DN10797_c0_g3_i1:23-427(+)
MPVAVSYEMSRKRGFGDETAEQVIVDQADGLGAKRRKGCGYNTVIQAQSASPAPGPAPLPYHLVARANPELSNAVIIHPMFPLYPHSNVQADNESQKELHRRHLQEQHAQAQQGDCVMMGDDQCSPSSPLMDLD